MRSLEPWALAGPRVRLRRLRSGDLPRFQHYRTDRELGRYQGWLPMDDAAAAGFLAEMSASPFCPAGRWCQIAIAEAVGLALQAVWAQTPARRVLGITDERNAAAVRLLLRQGFRRFATLDAVFRGELCREHHFVRHRPGQPDHARPVLRAATAADAPAVARVLTESRAALLPFLAGSAAQHTPEDDKAWVAGTLLPAGGVTVATVEGRVQAVLATLVAADGAGWIEQLYVHPTQVGAGLGRALLAQALAMLPRPLRLYTFQANVHAREFYERHGFVARTFGDGSGNEERCPDVLYELI